MTRHAFLRVGNKLLRGRDGTLDFSNHQKFLASLPLDAETEIMMVEIIEGDDEQKENP